jgi:hypothetical protein
MEETIDGDTNPTTNFKRGFSEYPVLLGMRSERVNGLNIFLFEERISKTKYPYKQNNNKQHGQWT